MMTSVLTPGLRSDVIERATDVSNSSIRTECAWARFGDVFWVCLHTADNDNDTTAHCPYTSLAYWLLLYHYFAINNKSISQSITHTRVAWQDNADDGKTVVTPGPREKADTRYFRFLTHWKKMRYNYNYHSRPASRQEPRTVHRQWERCEAVDSARVCSRHWTHTLGWSAVETLHVSKHWAGVYVAYNTTMDFHCIKLGEFHVTLSFIPFELLSCVWIIYCIPFERYIIIWF